MSENFIRHLISFLGFIIAIVVFFAGYIAGTEGLWGFAIITIVFYFIVYKLIEV